MCALVAAYAFEDMLMKNTKPKKNDHLQFPSGRTIKRCKEDAKQLRKASKNSDNYISLNIALNIVAKNNGIDMQWDKAVSHLINEAERKEKNEFEAKQLLNNIIGRVGNERSHHKKAVLKRFGFGNKIYLPDGEGRKLEVYPLKNSKHGLLISKEVEKILEADIKKLGGLESLKGFDDGNIQILYEKPNSKNHLAYEFHLNKDGVIHYFCRCKPWEDYDAELLVRGYSINNVGMGNRPADTALHW